MKKTILAFDRHFNSGELTNIELSIKAGIKKHSFRVSKKRNVGEPIEFWSGHPSKEETNPEQFYLVNEDDAEMWIDVPQENNEPSIRMPVLFAIENFRMQITKLKKGDKKYVDEETSEQYDLTLKIGSLFITTLDMLEVITSNDGFKNSMDFIRFFYNRIQKKGQSQIDISGQLCHWTSQVYDRATAEMMYKRS